MTSPRPATPAGPDDASAPGAGVWVVLPTYQEAENIGPMSAADPRGPAGGHPARRRRRLAGRHGRARRRPRRGRPAHPGPPSALQAGARPGLPRRVRASARRRSPLVVQMDADFSHDPAVLPGAHRPGDRRPRRPRDRVALHGRRRRGRLGHRPAGHLARRQHVRPDRARPGPKDLTGGFKAWRAETLAAVPFAGIHAGGYVFQIEMTFRADRRGRPDRRGPDRLPRPTGRAEQDVAPDRGRGAGRRRPAPGRGTGGPAPCAGDRRHDPPVGGRARRSRGQRQRRRRAAGPMSPQPTLRELADEPVSAGVRVVMDVRAIQEPERAPITAAYLDGLLGAFDADPLPGESFAFLLRSDLDDPTGTYGNLDVVGRRLLPPTRLLRSAALTIDPFLLRGASLGAAWRAERSGAAGAVYHTAGAGPLPIASGLPIVATLLDLAPWELPEVFARSASRAVRTAAAGPAPARGGRGHRGEPGRGASRPSGPAHPVGPAARRPARATAGVHPRRRVRGGQRGRRRDAGARAPGPARAIPRLLRPLRRAPGPRHAPAGAGLAGARRAGPMAFPRT